MNSTVMQAVNRPGAGRIAAARSDGPLGERITRAQKVDDLFPAMCSDFKEACSRGQCDGYHWATSRGHCK